jgi:pimeloyl-ACP methyl ester carboxylesterase
MKVTVKGVNLNVAQAGSGEHALVFLHFWGGSSREWSSVIDGLSPRFPQCPSP